MSNIGDEKLAFTRRDLEETRQRASVFKRDYKRCATKEMKADYFNFVSGGSPKDQAELFWALECDSEYELDEEMEEFLDYIRELPFMKHTIEMFYNMSVLFKRAWSNFMEIIMSSLQTAANNMAMIAHKREEKEKERFTDDKTFGKKAKKKQKDIGDDPFGEKDKNISTKVETTIEKDRTPKIKTFDESEATKVSREKPGKGGNGCVTFGWAEGGDSFFSGMSFDEPQMFYGPEM